MLTFFAVNMSPNITLRKLTDRCASRQVTLVPLAVGVEIASGRASLLPVPIRPSRASGGGRVQRRVVLRQDFGCAARPHSATHDGFEAA